ncbi:RNA-binding (RRM/RBD/RNP motifs) family protein [Actinidia rufa]|uniref:RNA-binding (RRM/RBD/RNP motifs) family protein n=1 Tax=Actinidia rufa TaxID=165716 RepID=A0A7J0ECR3_9ERIC|nr:RNA-binding (RRM/RBD/RNP motifs) family protein [Actinidia rufa]
MPTSKQGQQNRWRRHSVHNPTMRHPPWDSCSLTPLRTRDLERHFDPYGKILNVRIRRNFAFIQYESQEDAIKALDATNMSPDRSRDRSPGRRGQDRGQSLSPYRRERASPDYGRGRSPSPYRRGRASPDYGRGPSPSPHRKEKTNSDHGRSPRRERHSPDHGRERSPRQRVTPDYGHGSPSPQRERINRDNYQRDPSPDSKHELRDTAKYDGEDSPPHERYRSRSPLARERSRS